MKFLIFSLILIILIKNSNAIIINEIMADPIADENLNEWIELFNNKNEPINVSGWIIGDDKDNDTIEGGLFNKEGTIIEAFALAIITDDATRVYNNFNVSLDAIRLYIDDSSIGDGLSNDGETIYLYDKDGNLIDNKTYNKTFEDLSWAFLNNSLHKANPSPGFLNDDSIIIEIGCDYSVEFILAKTLFDNSSDFSFKIRASKIKGPSTNFTMRAKIEDLNGKFIRDYEPFTNESITRQKTSSEYTPNLGEGKSYIMSANITLECNDTIIENNFDTRIITIKGKPLREDSSIDIERIYDLGNDDKAKFGQTIRIKLNAYKGNTNKNSVAIWIEDDKGSRLSKESKTNLDQKYTNYSLTLPIQIKPNCDREFDDDDYSIIAEGLDSEDEEEVEIEDLTDSMCEEIKVEEKESMKKFEFQITDFNEIIEVGKKFNTEVKLNNNDDKDMSIKIWSYVYRGPKSYSGDREGNMNAFILKANTERIVELNNLVEEAESGTYKFKVLVNKDNQKTNNEITEDIIINNILSQNKVDIKEEEKSLSEIDNKITSNVIKEDFIYESSSEKAKNLVYVFILILSILLNVVFIWRR